MIFWKSSKGEGGGVIFNPKFGFGLWTFTQGPFREKMQYNCLRMRVGGGQRPFETFPKIRPFWYPDPSLKCRPHVQITSTAVLGGCSNKLLFRRLMQYKDYQVGRLTSGSRLYHLPDFLTQLLPLLLGGDVAHVLMLQRHRTTPDVQLQLLVPIQN